MKLVDLILAWKNSVCWSCLSFPSNDHSERRPVCVTACMVLIIRSPVCQQISCQTFFHFKEYKRYHTASDLWSFRSQEKATELLGADGQSRWITTVSGWKTWSPPPPTLYPQINPWTWNKETRSPSWSHYLRSHPNPSRTADSRQPPLSRL